MAETEYVIRNSQERPDKAGVVRPYLTRSFNGRQVPVSVVGDDVRALAGLGEPVPAPEGLETAPLRARDVHDLLTMLVKEQRTTDRTLDLIEKHLRPKVERPTPPRLTRWQRFRMWLHRLVRR